MVWDGRYSTAGVTSLLLLSFGCGLTTDGEQPDDVGAGVPVAMLQNVNGPSQTGTWCITRHGSSLRATPIVPEVGDANSEVIRLGDELWLFSRQFGEGWVAPLDGCRVGTSLPLSTGTPLWSNAAPLYLDLDEAGALRAGAPGSESLLVEPSGVVGARFSPKRAVAWYTRQSEPDQGLELWVLDLTNGLDSSSAPERVAERIESAHWSLNGNWLSFARVTTAGIEFNAYSLANKVSKVVAEYPGRTSVEIDPGPEEDHVLLHLPGVTLENDTEYPTEYRLVDLEAGAEWLFWEGPAFGRVEWLWPEPWVQFRQLDVPSSLVMVSESGESESVEFEGAIALLSPERGAGLHISEEGSVQVVAGLPRHLEPRMDLPSASFGAFSPDGRYWASLEWGFDTLGRQKDHGHLLHVAEIIPGGEIWQVAEFGHTTAVGIDGIRWLDSSSFMFKLDDGSDTSMTLAELTDRKWHLSEAVLPGTEGYFFALREDPCEVVQLLRNSHPPGCAAPWR